MKKIILVIALVIGVGVAVNAQTKPAEFKFEAETHDFGKIPLNKPAVYTFNFTNTGNQPAIITEAKVECSCTTVDFPKQPIAPNQSAKVIVKFDTKSVYDRQDRIVEIISNAKNSAQKIRFKGVVLK